MSTLSGHCRCGAVAYVVEGGAKSVVNCHCNLCRSMNGTAFSSYAIVNGGELSVTRGRDSLRQFAATDTAIKHFCAECGCPLFNTNVEKYGDHAMLYLGTLAEAGGLPEPVNIFHEDRLAWTDHLAGLVSYAQLPKR